MSAQLQYAAALFISLEMDAQFISQDIKLQDWPSFSSRDAAELMNFFPKMPTSSSSGFS
jgi:hypothetical protein